jgi:hypothetical protein
MVNADQYESQMREGKGAQVWRNGLWWSIQREGYENFAPVQAQSHKYFPDIQLLQPTLSTTGRTEIEIKYLDKGAGSLDIAQSGAGLRTFISLARILEQSSADVVLLNRRLVNLVARRLDQFCKRLSHWRITFRVGI